MRHNLLFRTDANARSRRALPGGSLWLLLLILALVLAGCVMPVAPAEPAAKEMGTLADKLVGLSSPIQIEILVEFYADMQREAEKPENDIDLVIVDADADAVKQFGDIEAFMAQGYDGIFFLLLTPEGMDDLVARAVDQGICMFNHSASPITGSTQNVVLDQHFSGYQVGNFAAEWIAANYGDAEEVQVGIMGNRADPLLSERTQGLIDGVVENAPNAVIAGEVEAITMDAGAEGAANLLQAHPDIKVLLSFNDDAGFGAYTGAREAGKEDPNQFFVGSADGTNLVLDEIAKGGIYQATWSYLFPYSSTQWMRDMQRCLRGEEVPPTRVQRGLLVTAENLEEVQKIVAGPQDPDFQHLYDDPNVMRYSDEAEMTPSQ
jgi:ribose transport system substrate-binding protein